MELHHFHIREGGAGSQCQGKAVAGVFISPRSASSPDTGVAACGEDDGVGQIHCPLARLQIECHRPEAGCVVDEQTGDVPVLVDLKAQFGRLIGQGVEHSAPRVIACIAGAAESVGAEETLIQRPFRGQGERAPPVRQFPDGLRGFAGQELHCAWIGQKVTFRKGIGKMQLPTILGMRVPAQR